MNSTIELANGHIVTITAVGFPKNDITLTDSDGCYHSLLTVAKIIDDAHDLAWHLAQLLAYRSGRCDGWHEQKNNPYRLYSDSFFSYNAGWLRGANDKAGGCLVPAVACGDTAAPQRDPSYVGSAPQFVARF